MINKKILIKGLKYNLNLVKGFKGIKVFTISTTSKIEEYSYLNPVRYYENIAVFGIVLFTEDLINDVIKLIDGFVDYVFVDAEKKIPNSSYGDNQYKLEINDTRYTGNLSKFIQKLNLKSEVYEFKPNDITVNATWNFLSQKYGSLSGKKVSIIGLGNIGSKLALKLVECGASINVTRRNTLIGFEIVKGLNFIKPKNNISEITFHPRLIDAAKDAEIIIGSTNGIQVIDEKVLMCMKSNGKVIDLGKNNLTEAAIMYAQKNMIEVWRVDVSASLYGFLTESILFKDILKNDYGIKKFDDVNIISGGIYGGDGDIVVNSINNIKTIFGISDGKGKIKVNLNNRDLINIEKLSKIINGK